jgi:hypothetical protein
MAAAVPAPVTGLPPALIFIDLVAYEEMYSGGINISGNWWGREQDAIGGGSGGV